MNLSTKYWECGKYLSNFYFKHSLQILVSSRKIFPFLNLGLKNLSQSSFQKVCEYIWNFPISKFSKFSNSKSRNLGQSSFHPLPLQNRPSNHLSHFFLQFYIYQIWTGWCLRGGLMSFCFSCLQSTNPWQRRKILTGTGWSQIGCMGVGVGKALHSRPSEIQCSHFPPCEVRCSIFSPWSPVLPFPLWNPCKKKGLGAQAQSMRFSHDGPLSDKGYEKSPAEERPKGPI